MRLKEYLKDGTKYYGKSKKEADWKTQWAKDRKKAREQAVKK